MEIKHPLMQALDLLDKARKANNHKFMIKRLEQRVRIEAEKALAGSKVYYPAPKGNGGTDEVE